MNLKIKKKFYLNQERCAILSKAAKDSTQNNPEVVKGQVLDLQFLFYNQFGLIVLRTFDRVKRSNLNANRAH